MKTNDKTLHEIHQTSRIKIQIKLCCSGVCLLKLVPGAGARSAPALWMPIRAPAREARRSSDRYSAPGAVILAPCSGENKNVFAPGSLGNISYQKPGMYLNAFFSFHSEGKVIGVVHCDALRHADDRIRSLVMACAEEQAWPRTLFTCS